MSPSSRRLGSHTCHGRGAVLVEQLEALLVLQRVHRRPEPGVALRHELLALHEPAERLVDQVFPGPDLVQHLGPHHEVAAVDPDVRARDVGDVVHVSAAVHVDDVEAVVGPHGEEARRHARGLRALDHRRQVSVGERVAVVRQEHLVVAEDVAHRAQTLADARVQAGVHERDVPVVDVGLEQMDLRAAVRQHEVVGHRLVVGEEEVLDRLGLVAQAQHEVGEPEVRVVLHHVPEDRAIADRDHRLGHGLGRLAHAHALPATEDDDLHDFFLEIDDEVMATQRRGTAGTVAAASPRRSPAPASAARRRAGRPPAARARA